MYSFNFPWNRYENANLLSEDNYVCNFNQPMSQSPWEKALLAHERVRKKFIKCFLFKQENSVAKA